MSRHVAANDNELGEATMAEVDRMRDGVSPRATGLRATVLEDRMAKVLMVIGALPRSAPKFRDHRHPATLAG